MRTNVESFELLPKEVEEKYHVKIDFLILRCSNPECNWHWGISLARRGTQSLTSIDLVCQKCAAEKVAKDM